MKVLACRTWCGLLGVGVFTLASYVAHADGGAYASTPQAEGYSHPAPSAVDVCSAFGAGYFQLAGTSTCLRIGGEVYGQQRVGWGRDLSLIAMRDEDDDSLQVSTASVALDPAFTGMSYRADLSFSAISPTDLGPLTSNLRLRGTDAGVQINEAELNFNGWTAGLRSSVFDVGTGYNEAEGLASDRVTLLLARTFAIRPGLTVTAAIEDGTRRRFEDGEWAKYDSRTMPDAVLVLDYEPGAPWIRGAIAAHHVRDARGSNAALGLAANLAGGYRFDHGGDASGRAILTGSVARGALDYLGIPGNTPDFALDAVGSLKLAEGYSALASYEHSFNARLKAAVTFSLYQTRLVAGRLDWRTRGYWASVGGEYIPVPGLAVGADLTYYRDQARDANAPESMVSADAVLGFAYVRRSF